MVVADAGLLGVEEGLLAVLGPDQLIGLAIIDRVGRRRLTLVTLPGAALALIVLGSFFVTGNNGKSMVPWIITTSASNRALRVSKSARLLSLAMHSSVRLEPVIFTTSLTIRLFSTVFFRRYSKY